VVRGLALGILKKTKYPEKKYTQKNNLSFAEIEPPELDFLFSFRGSSSTFLQDESKRFLAVKEISKFHPRSVLTP